MTQRAVIIGCGRGGTGSAGSHSIGYLHGNCYRAHPDCELVGAVDIDLGNLTDFQNHFALTQVGSNAAEVLAATQPDLVSICTYAESHRSLVEAAIAAGAKGIWCEKPFALTADDARAMVNACAAAGVRLSVNYLRRDYALFKRARDLIAEGRIGNVVLLMAGIANWDVMEWGCHWLDMFLMLQGDQVVPQWVFSQMRCDGSKRGYGHVIENHGITYIGYDNGARGLLDGGQAFAIPAAIRVIGSDGMLDIYHDGRLHLTGPNGLVEEQTSSTAHAFGDDRCPGSEVLAQLVQWMENGAEPAHSGRRALISTECYLAAYESAACGDRIDLPLLEQNRFPLDVVAARQRNHTTTH